MALSFSLIYAPLGAALKLVMALCRQSGQQNGYKIDLCCRLRGPRCLRGGHLPLRGWLDGGSLRPAGLPPALCWAWDLPRRQVWVQPRLERRALHHRYGRPRSRWTFSGLHGTFVCRAFQGQGWAPIACGNWAKSPFIWRHYGWHFLDFSWT